MTIKEFANEIYLTFSTKHSDLSSKKIERFVSFMLGTGMIMLYYIGRQMCWKCSDSINVNDVLLLSGLLFAYGGFNTTQIRKDKNDKPKENDTTNV
jgi:hypothetical protein